MESQLYVEIILKKNFMLRLVYVGQKDHVPTLYMHVHFTIVSIFWRNAYIYL